jgi:hypothetical protein
LVGQAGRLRQTVLSTTSQREIYGVIEGGGVADADVNWINSVARSQDTTDGLAVVDQAA